MPPTACLTCRPWVRRRWWGTKPVRSFFTASFAGAAHHAHHVGNFAFDALTAETASLHCYVFARALGKDGSSLIIHGRYNIEAVREAAGWKIARLAMDLLLPLA